MSEDSADFIEETAEGVLEGRFCRACLKASRAEDLLPELPDTVCSLACLKASKAEEGLLTPVFGAVTALSFISLSEASDVDPLLPPNDALCGADVGGADAVLLFPTVLLTTVDCDATLVWVESSTASARGRSVVEFAPNSTSVAAGRFNSPTFEPVCGFASSRCVIAPVSAVEAERGADVPSVGVEAVLEVLAVVTVED